MTHRVSCVRRDDDIHTYDVVTIDYDENACSGKEGCIADCKFDLLRQRQRHLNDSMGDGNMSENTFSKSMRYATWFAGKLQMEEKIEKILATCDNMIGEDDRRDLCEDEECPLYIYCVSIEPNFDYLDRTKTEEVNE